MKNLANASASKQGMSAWKKLLVGIASIPLLLCLCVILGLTIGAISSNSSTAIPSTSVHLDSLVPTATLLLTDITDPTQVSTTSDTPSNTPTLPTTKTPVPMATRAPKGLLPGLLPADVTANLESRGMECGQVEKLQMYYVRSCTRSESSVLLRVDVYGRQAFFVDLIEASVIQFDSASNGLAKDFLGFVSTMPYDGATPAEARVWIETSLPLSSVDGVEATFAGVKFALYGNSEALTLEIGDMP